MYRGDNAMPNNDLSRNDFIRFAATGTVAAMAAASCATSDRSAKRRPNFVIVFADDHAYRSLGYNNPVVKTPHMDRIARAGTILDRCYIASPICVASRASMNR